jgi:FecR protein
MRTHLRPIWVIPLAYVLVAQAVQLSARPLGEARLTYVVRNVLVRESSSSPAPVSLHGLVRDGSVRTGIDSGAELTFQDQTVARLSHETELAVNSNNRTLDLLAGAILTQAPTAAGGTRLTAADITATFTRTTVLVERVPNAYTKFIVLDGTARLCLKKRGHPSDCILLRAGQMLIGNPTAAVLAEPVDVDLERLNKTCHLLTDFPPLTRKDLLSKAVAEQRRLKSHGAYAETNLVIFGRGTLVNLIDPSADVSKADRGASSPAPARGPKSK